MQEIIDRILFSLSEREAITTKDAFHKMKNEFYATAGIQPIADFAFLERYRALTKAGTISQSVRIEKLLRKRAVRSLSGVAVISLLTKQWGCPGKCVFCPTYDRLPKSYISGEPAVMRAELNHFDPVDQVQNRLRSLYTTGNAIAKCDVRIIGGTWSVYPRDYQEMFIRSIYDAHTTYGDLVPHIEALEAGTDRFARFRVRKGYEMKASDSLETAKKRNETADSRVVGVAIETRPDWVTIEEILRLRTYGVTRVEIGYQTTFDEINTLNKRGHGNAESIHATRLLKDAGFKVVAHMMPNLLGSNPQMDRESLARIFDDAEFRPDELKIYPMVVTPHSELTEIWKNGGFKAYDDETLIHLMADLQMLIPEYVRLNRMYRDIPAEEILEGSKKANLRQEADDLMKKEHRLRRDISAREIRAKGNDPTTALLDEYVYDASGGKEHFLQWIDPADRTVFSLCRLRIPSQIFSGETHFIRELQDAAIVRELHTFGDQLRIGEAANGSGQHMGFGKKLMARCEETVRRQYPGVKKLAVIAGIGAREYYRMLGFTLEGEYMIKYFT